MRKKRLWSQLNRRNLSCGLIVSCLWWTTWCSPSGRRLPVAVTSRPSRRHTRNAGALTTLRGLCLLGVLLRRGCRARDTGALTSHPSRRRTRDTGVLTSHPSRRRPRDTGAQSAPLGLYLLGTLCPLGLYLLKVPRPSLKSVIRP